MSNSFVDQAVSDLAARLGVPAAAITVVSTETVVWPDKGYGCPRPGMVYAQVLSEGIRIVLSAGGVQYRYHSGDGRPPFLCEQ